MFLSIACIFLLGITIGFILVRSIIKQKMLNIENHWKQKLIMSNTAWNTFHKVEADKWIEKTKALINKTYFDAIEERDRAWKQRFEGIKSKSKPPSN